MCGIAGIVSKNKAIVSREKIAAAASCLSHRGPDADGTWINNEGTAALAHRRLSILDLSEAAAQPMLYHDRYCIIHNGEVYNYVEIRKELEQKGFTFRSGSDTEVIVAAYMAYGADCLNRFDGMFAFVIWDDQEKKLFAARDRFGEKPFFFFYDEEQLVFASEMKALWKMGISKEVNRALLYNFLTIGYTTNPADPQETFYQNIFKLPASSYLIYSLEKNELVIERYWSLDVELNTTISEAEATDQFGQLFSESIKKRLRSDVPVGTSLSGGLDSSAIVALCDELSGASYSHNCFTASFEGFEKNELQFAEKVAGQYNLQHHVVTINESNVAELMAEVMKQQEEPLSSASALAQFAVYRAAKQNGVTVLLDGQGADELLGGYHKYYKWRWQELYKTGSLKKSGELNAARALGITEPFGIQNKIASLMPDFSAGLLQSKKAKQAFRQPGLDRAFAFENKRNLYYSTPAVFDLNGALYFNTFVNGLEELLRLADRNSMAHGVEIRLPFLSHQLVEFLFTLPPGFKIHGGWTKWLLRKSVEDKLPAEIVWRKDKVGFEPPQKKWMENKTVQEAIQSGKKKLVDEGILDAGVLKKIQPHTAYAAESSDWKYWSASFLF
jgi:asparagine synthase (glutamine-hydrolysing)